MLTQGNVRTIARWMHIIVAIPILGYIYAPFDKVPLYAFPTRYIFFPVMLLTGLWMWKGHVVIRLFRKGGPDKMLGGKASIRLGKAVRDNPRRLGNQSIRKANPNVDGRCRICSLPAKVRLTNKRSERT